jgi:hypothetical protein
MSQSSEKADSVLIPAIKYILDRLVDLAISFGITYPTFEGLLKRSYVERASKGFKLEGKEQTNSRISLLTGLNRRDIRSLRSAVEEEKPLAVSLESRVARAWSSPPFIDKHGMRLALPRLASVGGVRSFETLVQHVSTDIRAAVLLEDWVTKGFAVIDEHDRVVFQFDKFSGLNAQLIDQSNNLAHTAGDLIAAYKSLMCNETPRPARVYFTNCDYLSEESLDEIFLVAVDYAEKAGLEINRRGEYASLKDRNLPDSRGRFTFCSYMYRADLYNNPPAIQAEKGIEEAPEPQVSP